MKFLRLNDILILTEKGREADDRIKLSISNSNDANCIILCKNTETAVVEFVTREISNGACEVERELLPDGIYTIKLCLKSEHGIANIAYGRFKILGGVVCADPFEYSLEIQKVWCAIAYIAEMLSVDEANIDRLVTGYITE